MSSAQDDPPPAIIHVDTDLPPETVRSRVRQAMADSDSRPDPQDPRDEPDYWGAFIIVIATVMLVNGLVFGAAAESALITAYCAVMMVEHVASRGAV
jgi:hypothetical protein